MSFIRSGAVALLSSLFLSACIPNGDYVNPWNQWNPWGIAPPASSVPVSYTDVYKYQGSRQCEGGGVPLAEMQRQLQNAGAGVTNSTCGMDGRMYPAFCGGADGKINIFTINSTAVNAALSQGFSLLRDLPEAQKTSCYTSNNTNNNTGGSTTYPYAGTGGDTSYYTYRLKP